jgi:pimeloyl-ACP methyl ester carboxylesterase
VKQRWSNGHRRTCDVRRVPRGEEDATSDFILVPGAGGRATPFWHPLSTRLERVGHRVHSVDLPGDDPEAGLPEYAEKMRDVIERCREPVVVAQSMGGFSAVMACDRVAVGALILVNAMVPAPGETPGEWWGATGAIAARTVAAAAAGYDTEFDLETYFLHDLEPEDAAAVLADPGEEADIAFGQPCDVEAWPDVATAAIVGRDDRLFPVGFQRELLRQRVGVDAKIIPGGHLLALANPDGLFDALHHLIDL